MAPTRHDAVSALTSILQWLPEDIPVAVTADGLTRDMFDMLRGDNAESKPLRKLWWYSDVIFSGTITLHLSTCEAPKQQQRLVS